MLPEPPSPPSPPPQSPRSVPPATGRAAPARPHASELRRQRRTDMDTRPGQPAPNALAADPASADTAAPLVGAKRWTLPTISLLLAASAAVLAAAIAWLLTLAFELPPAVAAGVAAAVALLAASVPTLAVALTRLRPASPAPLPPVQAVHDSATGAYRIDVFMQLAEREWSRARRYGTGVGLLVIDLDKATALNELHGPGAAEAFLNALSSETAPTLRGADLVTRLAPLQLGVFLAQADPTGALDVAERIRERAELLELRWPALPAADVQGALQLRTTVSVGVAALRPAHLNLQALVHDALDAVNAAHLAGGNCVRAAPVDTGSLLQAGPGQNDQRARPQS